MTNSKRKVPFATTAECVNLTLMERMLQKGADISLPVGDANQELPIMVAARMYNVAACKRLITAGADVNATIGNGPTALAHVVRSVYPGYLVLGEERYRGAREIISFLMEQGADPRAGGENSALTFAVALNLREFAQLMMAHSVEWPKNLRSLFYYDANGTLFATEGADLQAPLKQAMEWGVQDVIVRLLQLGADDSILSDVGVEETPFQVCVALGWTKVVEYYVKERDEDLAQRLPNGRTLLQHAREPAMRELLRSMKSAAAVSQAVDSAIGESQESVPKRKGMSPL